MKIGIPLLLLTLAVNLSCAQKVDYDKRLKDLGISLPQPIKPIANFVRAVRTGNLIYLSGHGPMRADGTSITGKLGKDLTIEQVTRPQR